MEKKKANKIIEGLKNKLTKNQQLTTQRKEELKELINKDANNYNAKISFNSEILELKYEIKKLNKQKYRLTNELNELILYYNNYFNFEFWSEKWNNYAGKRSYSHIKGVYLATPKNEKVEYQYEVVEINYGNYKHEAIYTLTEHPHDGDAQEAGEYSNLEELRNAIIQAIKNEEERLETEANE